MTKRYFTSNGSSALLLPILVYWLSLAAFLNAQSVPLRFEHLSVEQGLSQQTVQAILEDHLGYLWFGTLDGLNCYDGYEFKVYSHSLWDSTSIGHNNVIRLAEDKTGALWILTATGVSRIRNDNQENGIFENFDIPGVSVLMIDEQDQVWLGGTGLMKYSPEQDSFVTLDSVYPQLSNIAIDAILKGDNSTLWIGSVHHGLFRITQKDDGLIFDQYRHSSDDPSSISDNFVQTLFEDSHGYLWVGTQGGGLNRFNPARNSFEQPLRNLFRTTRTPKSITAILEDQNQRLWIGCGSLGLISYDLKTGNARHYKHNPANPAALSHHPVTTLLEDHSGMIWIGTNGGGLNRLDPEQLKLNHFYHEEGNSHSLNHNSVWSFYEDRKGNFWVGTNQGLSRMVVDESGATRFISETLPLIGESSRQVTVRSILEDHTGRLWIGSQNNGLFEYDLVTKYCRQYLSEERNRNSISSNYIYDILEDRNGDIWIAVNGGGGLTRLVRQTDGRRIFQRLPAVEKNGGWVLCLFEDQDGELWLGTWDHGLIKYDRKSGKFIPLKAYITGGQKLNEYTVLSIAETDSALWLGTASLGLCRVQSIQADTVYLTPYTTREGLSNNMIYGILADDTGDLWMSSNRGISRFSPKLEKFQNFAPADGLQGMEFNLGAAYRRHNGEMVFGGNNGFNVFYPSALRNETPPRMVLTAVKKFGEKLSFKVPTSQLQSIDLSYKDDYITLEYVGLHYKHPAQNQYAYILEGFDREWHYVGNKREAIYTNLPSGEYVFRVKAANSDGVWSQPSIGLRVIVHPPWWRTWWFYLLCAVIVGLTVLGLLHIRVRQAVALEKASIAERDRERDRIRRDLHVELGGTLSAVQQRLGKLIKKKQPPETPTALQLKKASQLLQELEQLFREYLWVLDREQMTLFDLVAQLKEYGESLFEDAEITLHIEGVAEFSRDYMLPLLWRQHLVRIFKEAINNVFRHSRNCKNVTLKVSLEDQWLDISLTDDGSGFDIEDVSNGIGLQDMYERAKRIGGKLIIHSEPGKGTVVNFRGACPAG